MPFNGRKFAERREQLNLTQFDVSERTRVTHADGSTSIVRIEYISTYENGRKEPSADSFMRLCKAVDLDPRELWLYE